jgi:hypothetical protein
VFRSSLIQACSCRPLIFVLSNPVRADKPLSVFSFNTKPTLFAPEPIRVMRRRDEALRRRLKGIQLSTITSGGSSFIPRRSCPGLEQSPQQLFVTFIRDIPARTCVGRWSCSVISACIESPPAFPSIFSETSCEILSRGIAKRVTPLRRCESIPSLDKHHCNARSVQPGLFMNAVARRSRPKPAGASRK